MNILLNPNNINKDFYQKIGIRPSMILIKTDWSGWTTLERHLYYFRYDLLSLLRGDGFTSIPRYVNIKKRILKIIKTEC